MRACQEDVRREHIHVVIPHDNKEAKQATLWKKRHGKKKLVDEM